MSLQNFIANYAAYNYWANKKITDWLKNIPVMVLQEQVKSSFTSLDYTLQHILRAQKFWLAFISEEDLSNFNWVVRENEAVQILEELEQVSEKMQTMFCSFSEHDLEKTLHLDMPWAKNALSRYEYIVHVINHSTYHRGQVITIARILGIEEGFVNTDYNFYNMEKA
jgi:uncharacterized damage-inducible protein DinB